MRCVYLSLVDVTIENGYDRKTFGQLKAFYSYGWETSIVCYKDNTVVAGCFDGGENKITWNKIYEDIGTIIKKRVALFLAVVGEIKKCKPDLIYIRYPRADILFAAFILLLKIRWPRIISVCEIPTYPFNKEHSSQNINDLLLQLNEFIFRPAVNSCVTAYSVVAYAGKAFGKRSIRIENGLDWNILASSPKHPDLSKGVNLIFAANFAANNYRHGLDRLLRGFDKYVSEKNNEIPIYLHIVGDMASQGELLNIVNSSRAHPFIVLHGRKSFSELKELYKSMHIGIGCLGFHRIGVAHTSALKEREYLSFGLPIVSSSSDFSFDENFPYRLKIADDDTDVDVDKIVSFAIGCYSDDLVRDSVLRMAFSKANWPIAMSNLKEFVEGK